MGESITELRAREDEAAHQWQRLHDALNKLARDHAELGEMDAFRLMHEQAMAVGQRRLELSLRIAEFEGPQGVAAR